MLCGYLHGRSLPKNVAEILLQLDPQRRVRRIRVPLDARAGNPRSPTWGGKTKVPAVFLGRRALIYPDLSGTAIER